MKTKQETTWQAWRSQAATAIANNQSLTEFVLHCHPDNRKTARKAYLVIRQRQGFVYGK